MATVNPPPASVALASTVTAERTTGIASAAGSASTASKGDHTHGSTLTPTANVQAASGTTASVTYTPTLAGGTAASLAVVIPASGAVLVIFSVDLINTTAGNRALCSVACSGTDTVAASDAWARICNSGAANDDRSASVHLFTGLTPGATDTFTLQFRVPAGSATVVNQELVVVPL